VPVSITEFGMTGLLEGIGGVDLNVRTDFVKNTIVKYKDICKDCGLTWWALGDYNTPYLRQSPNKYQYFPRIPDQNLFVALNLKKKKISNSSSDKVVLPYKLLPLKPRTHEDFSSEEIVFLMTADGEDEKCIRDQLGPGLDLLRKDTINHKRYSRPIIYTWIKKIVKDCSN